MKGDYQYLLAKKIQEQLRKHYLSFIKKFLKSLMILQNASDFYSNKVYYT